MVGKNVRKPAVPKSRLGKFRAGAYEIVGVVTTIAALSVATTTTTIATGRKKLGIRRKSVATTSPTWSGLGTTSTTRTATLAETLTTTMTPTLQQNEGLVEKGTCATDVTMSLPISPLPDTSMTLSQEMESLERVMESAMVSAHRVQEMMTALTSAWERKRDARRKVSTELAQLRKRKTLLEDELARHEAELARNKAEAARLEAEAARLEAESARLEDEAARLQGKVLHLTEEETQQVEEDRLRLEDVPGHEV